MTSYYIDVIYSYNGEEKTVKRLSTNAWETVGSTIHFYLTPEGNAFRNTVPIGQMDLMWILVIFTVIILACLKKFGILGIFTSRKKEPMGIVINDYDIPLDGPKEKMQPTDSLKE